MTDLPLIDLIDLDRKWRLEDWWSDFLAACERRRANRTRNSLRSSKGEQTKRSRQRARDPLRREA